MFSRAPRMKLDTTVHRSRQPMPPSTSCRRLSPRPQRPRNTPAAAEFAAIKSAVAAFMPADTFAVEPAVARPPVSDATPERRQLEGAFVAAQPTTVVAKAVQPPAIITGATLSVQVGGTSLPAAASSAPVPPALVPSPRRAAVSPSIARCIANFEGAHGAERSSSVAVGHARDMLASWDAARQPAGSKDAAAASATTTAAALVARAITASLASLADEAQAGASTVVDASGEEEEVAACVAVAAAVAAAEAAAAAAAAAAAVEQLSSELLFHVAGYFEWDFCALAQCSAVCRGWRVAFGAALRALPHQLRSAREDLENGELLRRYILWGERRRLSIPSLRELVELGSLALPPHGVSEVVNAALSLAMPSSERWAARAHAVAVQRTLDWGTARRGLMARGKMIEAMAAVKIECLAEETVARVRRLRGEEYFSHHAMQRKSSAAAGLVAWSLAVVDEFDFFAVEVEAREARDELLRMRRQEEEIALRVAYVTANPHRCAGCSIRFPSVRSLSRHRQEADPACACAVRVPSRDPSRHVRQATRSNSWGRAR